MNKVSSSIIYMQPGGVKQVDGQFLSTAELHLSSSLGEGDSMDLPTQQQQQQQTPFWEDLEPFQPVTAKAYWRHTDVPSIACYHTTPRAMWKLDHEHQQEFLPEVDVVLTCADVFSLATSKLHGIWATKRKYRVIDAHGNVPPQHLILYPPGVFPQEEEEQDMVVARGKWSFPVKSQLTWPPLTEKAKAHLRQYGNLPQWSPTSTEFTPKTATVFTEDTDWSQPKKSEVSGVWKIEDEDIWYPQYVLVYPMEAKLDEEHDTIGLWGLEESAKPNPENGSWNPKHVWFLPPGKALKGLRVCGQWAYSPTQPNGTWPALTVVTNKTIMNESSKEKEESSPIQSTRQRQETGEEKEQEEEPSESSETSGMSNTSFLSRNSAAAAAIRKKREIEQRFSGTSLQEMAEATKRRSSLGESARSQKALLKKRILERRYSSISSRQEAAARKSPAPRYSFSETLRLSEITKSMLEASSALIASLQVSPSSPLPPSVEESPIAPRKTATLVEPSISKVQLMEALLAEQGSLLVLCTESPDSKTMSLDQDNALLLCYDVPEYEILYIENEPTLGQELLQVSKKSIFPQFFFEPLLQDDSDEDDDEEGNGEEPKYVYLGGFATVRAILAERMSSQYRTSEMEERRKGRRRRLTRSKSNDV